MDTLWTSHSFDMLGALTGVLLLIFACAWLLRRMQQGQASGRQHLKVVSVLPLSTKERIVLLQAGDEQVLMGVSSAGIQHLHTLREPVATGISESGSNPNPASIAANFADQLRSMMNRTKT